MAGNLQFPYPENTPALFVLEDAIYHAYSEVNDPFVAEDRAFWSARAQEAEGLLSKIDAYQAACQSARSARVELARLHDKLRLISGDSKEKADVEDAASRTSQRLAQIQEQEAELSDDIKREFASEEQALGWARKTAAEAADFDIRKKRARAVLHRSAQTLTCGQLDQPLPYNQGRELRMWLYGFNTFAWRFLDCAEDDDACGAFEPHVEAVLPRTLERVFAAQVPACLYTVEASDPAINRLRKDKTKAQVADLFLSACLPRLGCGTPQKIPPRLRGDGSVNQEGLEGFAAGRRIMDEVALYARLEECPVTAPQGEGERKLRAFKRMLPILIMTGANPLFNLDVWDSPQLYGRVTEWMERYAYGATAGDYAFVVSQSFQRVRTARRDHHMEWMSGSLGVPAYYQMAYGARGLEEESLSSTESWGEFPAPVRAKAELIYNTLVCAAMSSVDYLLRDAAQASVTPQLTLSVHPARPHGFAGVSPAPAPCDLQASDLVLKAGSSALLVVDALGKNGKRASEVIRRLDLAPGTWRDIALCRTTTEALRKVRETGGDAAFSSSECVNTGHYWLGDTGKCPDSALHARIFAGTPAGPRVADAVCLADEGSKNGLSVLRDGVHYVVGAGRTGRRLENEQAFAAQLGHAAVVDVSGAPFPLRRGDRIFLALYPTPDTTPSYVIL